MMKRIWNIIGCILEREREREKKNTVFQARFCKLYSGECKVQNLELLNTLVT